MSVSRDEDRVLSTGNSLSFRDQSQLLKLKEEEPLTKKLLQELKQGLLEQLQKGVPQEEPFSADPTHSVFMMTKDYPKQRYGKEA